MCSGDYDGVPYEQQMEQLRGMRVDDFKARLRAERQWRELQAQVEAMQLADQASRGVSAGRGDSGGEDDGGGAGLPPS